MNEESSMYIDPQRIELLDPVVAKVLQSKTPGERIRMGFECNRTARRMMAAGLSSQHPDWTDEEIQREIARRMLDGAI